MLEVMNKPLTEEERLLIIRSQKISPEIQEYIKNTIQNLKIKVCSYYEESIIELIHLGKLAGWAWETTVSVIVFFNDEDSIERGYLKFSEDKNYYHAWICFKYQNTMHVFDPCLGLLCEKELFDKVLEPKVVGRTTAKEVREELIYKINYPKKKEMSEEEKWMNDFIFELCPNAVKKQDRETIINGSEDTNSIMYRNHTGYIADIEEGQIRKLTAHFYNSSC